MSNKIVKTRFEYAYKNSKNEYLYIDYGICDTIDGFNFSPELKTYSQWRADWIDHIITYFGTNLNKEKYIITTTESMENA